MTAAVYYFQKQPPEVFCKQAVLKKNHKIHRKAPMLASFLNKVGGTEACFPVNLAELLKSLFLQNSSGGCY